ncbi:MAG: tRNA uridine-5-carboxymethylaminomethyl(34) synthesis GTPase MnmE, partial [Thiohalospira sp.]
LCSQHGDSVTAWLTLHNKIDRTSRPAGEIEGNPDRLAISADSGAGLDVLAERVGRLAGATDGGDGFLARRRHVEALNQVAGALERAGEQWRAGGALELVAEDLRRAHEALGTITGRVTSEDLLGGIFSSFCIGK